MNEVNKLTTHFQNVDKDAFFGNCKGRSFKPSCANLSSFGDPDYQCFSFGSIDLCPNMEEYRMLTKFPNNLYRIYLPLRSDKIIPELSKLLRNLQLGKVFGKECYRTEMEDARN
jgi:hypothetical protein